MAGPVLEEKDYLPDVLQHLDQARLALESGQTSIALAHTRIVLHDQGLNVYFDTSSAPSQIAGDCRTAGEEAVKYWNEALGEGSLKIVDNASEAQVTVQFTPEVLLKGVQVGGFCSQSRSVTSGTTGEAVADYEAVIHARTNWPGGRALSRDYLRNIVTHEVGHIYGLNDCADANHMMGPLSATKTKFELHPDEFEALRRLRLTAFETQRNILAKAKGS